MAQLGEESIFNMALAYLKRIDKLLTLCSVHSMNGNIDRWYNTLLALHREVSIKLKNKEEKEIFTGSSKNRININEIGKTEITSENSTINNINLLMNSVELKTKYRKYILFMLNNFEVELRKIMQKKGMLLPSKDDPRLAITRR